MLRLRSFLAQCEITRVQGPRWHESPLGFRRGQPRCQAAKCLSISDQGQRSSQRRASCAPCQGNGAGWSWCFFPNSAASVHYPARFQRDARVGAACASKPNVATRPHECTIGASFPLFVKKRHPQKNCVFARRLFLRAVYVFIVGYTV